MDTTTKMGDNAHCLPPRHNATLDGLDTQYYNDDGELNIREIEEMAKQTIQASGWLDP
ncbi:hypothetical protein VTO73DRAFT_8667 [Trametes versicolor]